jgi:hypothetical protein
VSDRWEVSGPEEGDTVDLTVLIMFDGLEVIKFNLDAVKAEMHAAKAVVNWLNKMEATLE